jgi:Zn-dependent protease
MNARAAMQVGTIARIPLRVHVSWLVALFLMTSSLSISLAESAGAFAPFVALVTAIALFASLVAHELGHALVARRCGVGVSAITLFVFGGVATLESEPRRPRDELAIASMGPIVSLVIAGVAASLAFVGATHGLPAVIAEPLWWLARVNLGIAIFNLVPGFPLDGGRILRAAIWAVRRDAFTATMSAARIGRGIAYAMIALGVSRWRAVDPTTAEVESTASRPALAATVR